MWFGSSFFRQPVARPIVLYELYICTFVCVCMYVCRLHFNLLEQHAWRIGCCCCNNVQKIFLYAAAKCGQLNWERPMYQRGWYLKEETQFFRSDFLKIKSQINIVRVLDITYIFWYRSSCYKVALFTLESMKNLFNFDIKGLARIFWTRWVK